jgi:hypothetical protein
MTTYLLLRTIRLILWGAFVLSLGAATSWRQDVNIGPVIRYFPPMLLVVALVVGFVERSYRQRQGLTPKRLWSD